MLHVKLTSLATKKLDNLAAQTVALSEQNANPEIANHPLLLAVKSAYAPYHQNIVKPTYSGMGPDLAAADLQRDNCHSGLRRLLRGYLSFGDTDRGQAAKQLLALFDETGSITRLSYAEENTVLEKLIEKLGQPEAQQPIDLLGVRPEVDRLVEAQARFSELYLRQIDANSQLRQEASASALRRELSYALRNYYGYVSAMSGLEGWKDIYADLKELIAKSK
jgi:hypothetical protein